MSKRHRSGGQPYHLAIHFRAAIPVNVRTPGQDDPRTVLLLGDSNLAQLYYQLPDLVPQAFGTDVECRAVGGARAGSLRHQVGDRALPDYDAIVASIGSSDNLPDFASSPTIFGENLSRELERGGRWVAMLPPGVLRAFAPNGTDESTLSSGSTRPSWPS